MFSEGRKLKGKIWLHYRKPKALIVSNFLLKVKKLLCNISKANMRMFPKPQYSP